MKQKKRIAILGCENSHADAFLKFIRTEEAFSHLEVVGVYSDRRESALALQEKFDVPVLDNFTDAVGKIDGLVITARHGNDHYRFAKPYLDDAIPMFIDKPITVREDEAVEFMRELMARSIRITGGSSLKEAPEVRALRADALAEVDGKTLGGFVRAPYQKVNDYGNFYFYSQHLVEMVCEIFGRYPLSVTARENGDNLHVLFHYENYDCVGLFTDRNYLYFASRMAEKGSKALDVASSGGASNGWFRAEFAAFCELLDGGEQKISYADFISPVFIMNAIERSLASGREEAVRTYTL